MKQFLVLVFLSILAVDVQAQDFKKSSLTLNPITSGAYSKSADSSQGHWLGYSVGLDVRYRLSFWEDRYRVGLTSKVFWRAGVAQDNRFFYAVGPFQQFYIFKDKKVDFYIENNIQISDLCICDTHPYWGQDSYIPRAASIYLGFGAGLDWQISKRIDLSFAQLFHFMLQPNQRVPQRAIPWRQIILPGITYYFYPRE